MAQTDQRVARRAPRALHLLLALALLAALGSPVAAQAEAESDAPSTQGEPDPAPPERECDQPMDSVDGIGWSPMVSFPEPIDAEGDILPGETEVPEALPVPRGLHTAPWPPGSTAICMQYHEPTVEPSVGPTVEHVDELVPAPDPPVAEAPVGETPVEETPVEVHPEPVTTPAAEPPARASEPDVPAAEAVAPCDCDVPTPPDPAPAPTSPAIRAPATEPAQGAPMAAAFTPAGAAVVGVLLVWRLLALLTARSGRERPLHPRAESLLRTVCATPGLNLRQLRQAAGLANGVALHHLARLLRDGRVVAHRHRNTLRFFENHGRYAQSWRQAAVLGEPSNRRLLGLLAANPGMSQAAIVAGGQEWGWGRGLTQKRLSLLEEAGLLLRRREGREVRHEALPPAAALPQELRDLPGPILGASAGKL